MDQLSLIKECRFSLLLDPVEEQFSFTNLNDEQLYGRLRGPVRSEIVNPCLNEQNFWKDGEDEGKMRFVDEIVHEVAVRKTAVASCPGYGLMINVSIKADRCCCSGCRSMVERSLAALCIHELKTGGNYGE